MAYHGQFLQEQYDFNSKRHMFVILMRPQLIDADTIFSILYF